MMSAVHLKTSKRKDGAGKHELGDFRLLDLFALADSVAFGTGECCLEALVPALLKKVLSAGECGVKPRGFGLGIFYPALRLLHQHMCSVNPWLSWCATVSISTPLDVVSRQYTVGTRVVLLR